MGVFFLFLKSIRDFFKNPVIAVPNILFSVIMMLLDEFFLPGDVINKIASGEVNLTVNNALKIYTFSIIFILLTVFITPFLTSWVNLMCRKLEDNGSTDFFKAFKESFKYYFRMLGAIVIKALIAIGFIIAAVILLVPVIAIYESGSTGRAIGLLVIMLILLFIAFIFFMTSLIPVESILVYDNLPVGKSISRGFKFGIKKFFPLLGILALLIIINSSAVYFIGDKSIITTGISTILTSYLGVFLTVFTVNMYKKEKEKTDEAITSDNSHDNQNDGNEPSDTSISEKSDVEDVDEDAHPADKFRI